VVHGLAAEVDGKTTLLMGPHGVGKSTIMRELAAEGRARIIDDGFVVIGRDKDSKDFHVVSSGLVGVNKRFSDISKVLRSCCGYKSAFLDGKDFEKRNRRGRRIQQVTNFIGYLVLRPKADAVESVRAKLERIVLLRHERDTVKPGEISLESYSRMGFDEFMSKVPGIEAEVIDAPLPADTMKKRLRDALTRHSPAD
jgi:hypothetical protein